jgi:ligand-binding sensor domain-containing protein/two-component sensor histidine kinase
MPLQAQQQNYTAFTVNNGLPSNHIYQCLEDNKGFLWVATDAGIARFDGKHFQVFTTQNGLPDNEVLQIAKEANGTIWVNCLRQSPAYFDEVQNRFINANENKSFAKVNGTTNMNLIPLPDSGMLYKNEKGSFIFYNKWLDTTLRSIDNIYFDIAGKDHQVQWSFLYSSNSWTFVFEDKKLHKKEQIALSQTIERLPNILIRNRSLYISNTKVGKCYIFSRFTNNPIRYKVDSISVGEPICYMGIADSSIFLSGHSGKMYIYNNHTKKLEQIVNGNYLSNTFYKDSNGNSWVCTVDKGLLLYRNNIVKTVFLPPTFTKNNFLSIAKQGDQILAGNYYGAVAEIAANRLLVHKIVPKQPSRQRKIIVSGNDIYTVSEDGVFLNFQHQIFHELKKLIPGKTGMLFNDTTVLVGTVVGISHIHTKTQQAQLFRYKRVLCMDKSANGLVYFGSTDGLYTYNVFNHVYQSLQALHPAFSERIVGITSTPDSLLWVATPGKGIIVLKNNVVVDSVNNKNGVYRILARCIMAGKNKTVWVGTSQGISRINYYLKNGKLTFNIQNINVNDELSSTEINEMILDKDSIYAATGNGIFVIPTNVSIPKFNIPVELIRISVNQQDTTLSAYYKLRYDQQNIQMQFAGIELSGHFKNLQYSLDENGKWTNLDENTLTVQLNSGTHFVQVRALDVNGNISDKILKIRFDIATPFWNAIWFWAAIAIVLPSTIIYLMNLRQKKRKEAKLAKEIAGVQIASLEQKAFTSLMNPHFMFNALNSIQHYINVQDRQNANRYLSDFASLIRKNFEAAQLSFIPLEQEIENIKIYLRLEQMRFNEGFSYQIKIEENLDTEDWMIPTMILQPLLENALLHGMMLSALEGELLIELKLEDSNLVIIITDNGIGIVNSMALKEISGHKSRGMELIKKRIAALSHFGSQVMSISMSPAFESEKNPGNKITLFVPVELHSAWLQAQQH